jgi:hypothetical protein
MFAPAEYSTICFQRCLVLCTDGMKQLAVALVVICTTLLATNPAVGALDSVRDRGAPEAGARDIDERQDIGTSCTSSMTGTFGNVIVPNGASCTLSNVIVGGNVHVGINATLSVGPSSTIAGNVQAHQCGSVLLSGAVVIMAPLDISIWVRVQVNSARTHFHWKPGLTGMAVALRKTPRSTISSEGPIIP